MSKIINVKKAKMMYEKARQQEFINNIQNKEITETVEEMIKKAADYGIDKAKFVRIIRVSKSTLTEWANNNSRKEIVFWCLYGIERKYNIIKNANRFELDGDDYE